MAGFGGSPAAEATEGGKNAGNAAKNAAKAGEVLADALDKSAEIAKTVGEYVERADDNKEKAKEAAIEKQKTQAEIAAAQIRLAIAQQEQANHQAQVDRLQQQIDFLTTGKFTTQDLYDWMVGVLADTYFQSYRLAYRLCQQVERCYRYELSLTASSFIRFGYWDSLKKGLLAGETLSHDLRRMQASYVEQNARRFETSRFVSLAALDPQALLRLLETGACTFDLPEALFDGDYPGHYQRRLVRVSVTVLYPDPGRFDNVKSTLTLTKNSVRMTNDLGAGYPRQAGADPRFADQFGAVPQRIVLGNAQDDPGLFLTSIDENLGDPRYLPFEGAGAISSWHLELPAETNDIDLATVADVVLHLHYTSLDGGDAFKQAVEADNAANAPNAGALLLSATGDFPETSWQRFLAGPGGGGDQELTLNVSASKFPRWTRGKTDHRHRPHGLRNVPATGQLRARAAGAAAGRQRDHDTRRGGDGAERRLRRSRRRGGVARDVDVQTATRSRRGLPLDDRRRRRRRVPPRSRSRRPDVYAVDTPAFLHRPIERLVHALAPTRIVLFGSYAKDTARPGSDVDLLVIAAIDGDPAPHLRRARQLVASNFPPVDIVLCTPEEAENAAHERSPFLRSILGSGIIVYER